MAQCMNLGNLAQPLEPCTITVPELRVPSNPSSRASTLRPNSSVDVLGIHQGCGCRICQKLANKFGLRLCDGLLENSLRVIASSGRRRYLIHLDTIEYIDNLIMCDRNIS